MTRRTEFDFSKKYGAWTPIREITREERPTWGKKNRFVLCRCDCSREAVVRLDQLHRGRSTKCRTCAYKERGGNHFKHGCSGRNITPEYRIWQKVKQAEAPDCDRVQDFREFLKAAGPRPSPRHAFVRIDKNKGFSLDNCEWRIEAQYQKTPRPITYQGETRTARAWAQHLGIPKTTLHDWVRRGIDGVVAIEGLLEGKRYREVSRAVGPKRRGEVDNESAT